MSVSYATAPMPVRADLAAAHARAWDRLGRPGVRWTGAERVAIATEARSATTCALCSERKAALSPYTVTGAHDGPGALPPVAVDAIHRVVTDPGRLTRAWFESARDGGLDDAAYVELLGVVTTVVATDAFCRAIGAGVHPLPAPVPGEPTRHRPAAARDEGAWVPTIPSGAAGGPDADLYADVPGRVPNVIRALSLVPDELRTLKDLLAAHYVPVARIPDVRRGRAIDRAQMELVAGRVSALRECFY